MSIETLVNKFKEMVAPKHETVIPKDEVSKELADKAMGDIESQGSKSVDPERVKAMEAFNGLVQNQASAGLGGSSHTYDLNSFPGALKGTAEKVVALDTEIGGMNNGPEKVTKMKERNDEIAKLRTEFKEYFSTENSEARRLKNEKSPEVLEKQKAAVNKTLKDFAVVTEGTINKSRDLINVGAEFPDALKVYVDKVNEKTASVNVNESAKTLAERNAALEELRNKAQEYFKQAA